MKNRLVNSFFKNKKIIFFVAYEEELKEFLLKNKNNIEKTCLAGITFYAYKTDVLFVMSGIGKVNAASAAAIILNNIDKEGTTSHIYNIGYAGSLSSKYDLFDIVCIKKTSYCDFDVTYFGYKFNIVPQEKQSMFFPKEISLNLASNINSKTNKKIKPSLCYTADSFITFKNKSNYHFSLGQENAVVDMESNAILQVCNKYDYNNITVLKIVSDNINKENKKSEFDFVLGSKLICQIIETIIKA